MPEVSGKRRSLSTRTKSNYLDTSWRCMTALKPSPLHNRKYSQIISKVHLRVKAPPDNWSDSSQAPISEKKNKIYAPI